MAQYKNKASAKKPANKKYMSGNTGLRSSGSLLTKKSVLLILAVCGLVGGFLVYRSYAATTVWKPGNAAISTSLSSLEKKDGSTYWYSRPPSAPPSIQAQGGVPQPYSTVGTLTLNDPKQGGGTYCAVVQTFRLPGGVRFSGANAQLPSAQIPAGRYQFGEESMNDACVTADLGVGPLNIILERQNINGSTPDTQTLIIHRVYKKEDVTEASKKCNELSSLKFCDDFSGAAGALPDSTKWRVFGSGSSWGSQCWSNKPENISTDGKGNLKLSLVDTKTTQCQNWYGDPSTITSGGMDTQGKFTTQYGKFEIRAKLSCAQSVWGAFWLATGTGPAWPQSGEIDIYEIGYNKQNKLQQTIHAGKSSSDKYSVEAYTQQSDPFCKAFHVYGAEWREGYVQFFLDGAPTKRITKDNGLADATNSGKTPYWPFDSYDLRLLIDLQYGKSGTWTGTPNAAELPSSMLIDYVRIYN